MTDRDGPDRDTLTLLVQLFGREVLDRLAGAGFTDPGAIALAGVERLSREGGIPIAVARRIATVVSEAHGAVEPSVPETPADAEPPARAPRRRQARDSAQPPVPAPQAESASPARAASTAEALPPGGAVPSMEPVLSVETVSPVEAVSPIEGISSAEAASLDEIEPDDPFVDDVALVSWMGFSGQTSSGRMTFSVADAILDPPSRSAAGKRGSEAAIPPEVTAPPAEPPAARTIRIEPAQVRRPTLSGSFGARPRTARSREETAASPSPPATDPSRREPHGH